MDISHVQDVFAAPFRGLSVRECLFTQGFCDRGLRLKCIHYVLPSRLMDRLAPALWRMGGRSFQARFRTIFLNLLAVVTKLKSLQHLVVGKTLDAKDAASRAPPLSY